MEPCKASKGGSLFFLLIAVSTYHEYVAIYLATLAIYFGHSSINFGHSSNLFWQFILAAITYLSCGKIGDYSSAKAKWLLLKVFPKNAFHLDYSFQALYFKWIGYTIGQFKKFKKLIGRNKILHPVTSKTRAEVRQPPTAQI